MAATSQMASCVYCRGYVAEPYCAVVEWIHTGSVFRKTVLEGVHHHCARDWARLEIESLRRVHGTEMGFVSIVMVQF